MNKITFCAAILASIGVALGAFGAHALKDTLLESGTTDTWKTAVFYHLIHAVAAWALFLASPTTQRRLAKAATRLAHRYHFVQRVVILPRFRRTPLARSHHPTRRTGALDRMALGRSGGLVDA